MKFKVEIPDYDTAFIEAETPEAAAVKYFSGMTFNVGDCYTAEVSPVVEILRLEFEVVVSLRGKRQ